MGRANGRTTRWKKEAFEYVKNLLKGKKVLLEYDVQKYDRYGRTLAYVYLEDSTFLNAHLLKMGLAGMATYPPNVGYVEVFRVRRLVRLPRYMRKT